MKKVNKLFMRCIIILCLSFVFAIQSFAIDTNSNSFSENNFFQLQEDGYIGKDVSYEYYMQITSSSQDLERQLENNGSFTTASAYISSLQPGDILITNSTSSSGFTGHAAIALNDEEILHIAGPGYAVTVVSPDEFKNLYSSGWIKVYRPTDSDIGNAAADWADNNYRDSSALYRITMDLSTTNETYCSKIVWQAYYYTAGLSNLNGTWGIATPYNLPEIICNNDFYVSYQGKFN